MTDEKIAQLRSMGILQQKDKNLFIIRLGICAGSVSPSLLRKCAELSDQFGNGDIHLTTRQSIEIQNIPAESIDKAVEKMQEYGIPQFTGSKARVVACVGAPICRFSCGNTQEMALLIRESLNELSEVKSKVKFGITGCIRSCGKPQQDDIGLMAAGNGKWKIYAGGKVGLKPMLGEQLFEADSNEQAIEIIKNILCWHKENGKAKERIGTLIERLGKDSIITANA